ncbi:unnamed protein product [Eruca vesicaria subsp. sativa]|uniref:Uncharacterized protein n=1 Tax=Eruca vesicaria subsp. sativa TaxID=29727 RepID=A0ABC8JMA7_ERUVS|nr:unnamed protein product [Eruca vesicaria subsp. sativa]
MATAILSSRNSLNHRFDNESLIHRNPTSRLHRPSNPAPRRPKRSSTASQPKTLVASPASNNTNLVMGQVKILKRGETLTSLLNKENNSCPDDKKRHRLRITDVDFIVESTNRIRPEPETLHKQIRAFKGLEIVSSVDYAGASSSASPPPNSLPIPCFLDNKN